MDTRDWHFTEINHRIAEDCVARVTNGSVRLSLHKARRAIEGLAWLSRFGDLPTDESNPDNVRLVQMGLGPRAEVSEDAYKEII